MSQPISNCLQMKAIVDEEAHNRLFEINKSNHINGGHYTVIGCSCTPSCYEKYSITEDMVKEYNERLKKEWNVFMDEHDKINCEVCGENRIPNGPPGPTGADKKLT